VVQKHPFAFFLFAEMQAARAPLMLPTAALRSVDVTRQHEHFCTALAEPIPQEPLRLPPASLTLPVFSRSPASSRPAGGSPLSLPMRSRGSHIGLRLPALPGRPRTTSDLDDDDEPEAPRHDRMAVMLIEDEDEDAQVPELDAAAAMELVVGFEASVVMGTECAICFDEHAPDDCGWRKLPCGHTFHQACLCELVKCAHRHKCPLCRSDLSCGSKVQLPAL